MEKYYSMDEIQQLVLTAQDYFSKAYPKGATLKEVVDDEGFALEYYIKMYDKYLKSNFKTNKKETLKARQDWVCLETIERLFDQNKLKFAENLDFMDKNFTKQTEMFLKYLSPESYVHFINNNTKTK